MISHMEQVYHMTSQTHAQTGKQVLVFNCETHHSNGHLVIGNKKIDFKVKDWNSMK